MPRELAEEFEKLVGERNQSAEIVAMIERRLKQERLRAAFEALADSPKGPHPEWDGPGVVAEWVRSQRAASDGRRQPG
ncbi:MAG: hypothetical protein ABI577_05065 [bacterium]